MKEGKRSIRKSGNNLCYTFDWRK